MWLDFISEKCGMKVLKNNRQSDLVEDDKKVTRE